MVVASAVAAAVSGRSAHRERPTSAHQAREQSFIMLVSKAPLPAFTLPYPRPPPESRVADLRRGILDVFVPTKADRTTVTYAEQLRLSTLTSWRLGMLTLDLHQNALIDPATRESAVEQVGYRLEDDHECALIEDGDEIHVGLKDGCDINELQLPKLGSNHIYSAPANTVTLTRKGTISKPPPYSLLPPSEPSSHSSSIAAQPNANYHSHSHANDWRAPFRVIRAAKTGLGTARHDSHGASAAVGTTSVPASTASVLRQMPRASTSNVLKIQTRRRSSQQSVVTEARPPHISHHQSLPTAGESLPTYAAGHEVLNLPPTARVIGSGVQGTAGNARKRNNSRQNSYSSAGVLGATSSVAPLSSGGAGMNFLGTEAAAVRPSTATSRNEGFSTEPGNPAVKRKESMRGDEDKYREPSGPSRNANGAGTRRSSAASREIKNTLAPASRPGFAKHASTGYQSYLSTASQSKSVTAAATAAFLNSSASVSTPPIVNLSPFPELSITGQDASKSSAPAAPSADVSAAMLKHLRQARSSFAAAPAEEGGEAITSAETNNNGVVRLSTPPESDDSPGDGPKDGEADAEEGDVTADGNSRFPFRLKTSKGKGKAAEKDSSETTAQRADKRYREVKATLDREIAKQALADEARAAHYAEEQARQKEEQRKKEEEKRRQVTREKWELWEEVKKREKKEMKERKRRGEDVPEAPLGPTGAEIVYSNEAGS
ncbi:unnamed protein product [Tilletia laevis]|uniref:Uncharacterized protein n=3 Tax=Tilletia TaxID=13289 RepID=A0A8X7MME1_9BASI|nr:hypothetical protein CF336_g6615 [Tilletia laevis]KAE8189412.1 hypothetical protein CF328_g6292 [Tilletia controversa]KAE8253541.1 hypothetical protein A4X03_0g5872 [Tilletia caries]KAE8191905.1 hypothetical protein CF335_g5966 [Tilletia laevis]KAE8242162.1 hypothetical protein A4X06_0g7175 [Tilletia controversa]